MAPSEWMLDVAESGSAVIGPAEHALGATGSAGSSLGLNQAVRPLLGDVLGAPKR